MTEYTLTTQRVKDSYVWFRDEVTADAARVEFDRWLALVKAEVWAEGVEAHRRFDYPDNPYREETE